MFGHKEKQAYWTQHTHLLKKDDYICSSCGFSSGKPLPICPHCKAHMKKSRYDPSWVDEAEALSAILDDDW